MRRQKSGLTGGWRCCRRWLPSLCIIYMGHGWCRTEDPWNISAFFLAFMQLLLALLVLAHSVIACITSQMMRLYGWEYPSQRECMHPSRRIGRLNSVFLRKSFNLEVEPSMNTPLRSTENVLKRSSSENWQAVRTKSLLCPKCYGLWNAKQSLSFRCDKAAPVLPRQKSKILDMDSMPVERFPFAGSGTKSYADSSSRASVGNELASCQKYCFLQSSPLQQLQKSRSLGRVYDHFDDVGRVESYVETIHDNGDVADETESCLNTPAHDSVEIVTNVVKDADVCRDVPEEEVVSSSKELSENGLNKGFSNSADLNVGFQSSQSSTIALESRENIYNKTFTALPTEENGDKVSYFSAAMKNLVHEKDLISKDDDKDYSIENVIMGLKEAVLNERKKLGNLYAELETERISSETAANEAMSMISRLQEEKASLRMQAAHYRRIAEERATYDHQAMQLLKEILIKKEKENFLLQKQVYAMRSNCCKDVRTHAKRRKSFNRCLFPECQQSDLPKNEADEDGFHSSCITSEENEDKAPIEKQPLKRLKGNTEYLSSSVHRVVLKPEVYSSLDPLLSVGSDESQDSAAGHGSSKEDMEPQLCTKDVPRSSDEHDVLSQRENLSGTPCDGLSLWSV